MEEFIGEIRPPYSLDKAADRYIARRDIAHDLSVAADHHERRGPSRKISVGGLASLLEQHQFAGVAEFQFVRLRVAAAEKDRIKSLPKFILPRMKILDHRCTRCARQSDEKEQYRIAFIDHRLERDRFAVGIRQRETRSFGTDRQRIRQCA